MSTCTCSAIVRGPRTSTVHINGTVKDAQVSALGTSAVNIVAPGVGDSLVIDASGISTTLINSSDAAVISGRASGLAQLLYTGGTCDVDQGVRHDIAL